MKGLFAKYGAWLMAASGCITIALAIAYTSLELRVAFADDQVAIFRFMEAGANQSTDPQKVTGYLQYLVNYYPSGTKQTAGTPLNRIVKDDAV
jgi:hypothetical protein